MKDQLDVGSLSCSMMFQSISAPLQHSIRFFQPPNLQGYNTFHNVSSCCQEPFRVSTFPIRSLCWVRCLLSTGKNIVHEVAMSTRRSFFLTFWFKLLSYFSLLFLTAVAQIQISSPYQLPSTYPTVAVRRKLFSRFVSPMLSSFVTLSGQLFIHAPRFIRWNL